jgi:hypothetical protein
MGRCHMDTLVVSVMVLCLVMWDDRSRKLRVVWWWFMCDANDVGPTTEIDVALHV